MNNTFTTQFEITQLGHRLALTTVYPLIFPSCDIRIDTLAENTLKELDLKFGIDRIFRIYDTSAHQYVSDLYDELNRRRKSAVMTHVNVGYRVCVSERFVTEEHKNFDTVTVTEWNIKQNLPSECYKTLAQWGLFACIDRTLDPPKIIKATWVNIPALIECIRLDRFSVTMQRGDTSGDTFLVVPINLLTAWGIARRIIA